MFLERSYFLRVNNRNKWRREWDSNPRYDLSYTPLAGERLQPLGHLSIKRDPNKVHKLDQGEFNIILISVQHNFIIISVSQNTFNIISRFPIRNQLYPVNDF